MTAELNPGYAAPLVALDRVTRMDELGITTEKAVKPDEPYFAGHFPGRPVYPGVFILEAVNQAARYFAANRHKQGAELIEIRSMRFLSPVLPGDILECDCGCAPEGGFMQVRAVCRCGRRKVAEVKLVFRLEEPE